MRTGTHRVRVMRCDFVFERCHLSVAPLQPLFPRCSALRGLSAASPRSSALGGFRSPCAVPWCPHAAPQGAPRAGGGLEASAVSGFVFAALPYLRCTAGSRCFGDGFGHLCLIFVCGATSRSFMLLFYIVSFIAVVALQCLCVSVVKENKDKPGR